MVIIELICGLVNLKGKQRRSSNDKAIPLEPRSNLDERNTTLLTPLLRYE